NARSLTSSPIWTRPSVTTNTSGITNANSTAAEPRSPASVTLRGRRIADHRVDDLVEERRQLARRMRPGDQHDGDGRRRQDHQRILRGRLPFLATERAAGVQIQGNEVRHLLTSSQWMERTVVMSTGTTVRRRKAGRIKNTNGKSMRTGAVRARSSVDARRDS